MFVNAVGSLAIKENISYTVLREGFGRRIGNGHHSYAKKNKYRIFFDLEQENKVVPVVENLSPVLSRWLKSRELKMSELLKYGSWIVEMF